MSENNYYNRHEQLMDEFHAASQLAHAKKSIEPIKTLFKNQNLIYDNVDKDYLYNALSVAIDNSYLEIIKYILTSPDLEYHPKFNSDKNLLKMAAKSGDLEMFIFFRNRFDLDYPNRNLAVIYHDALGDASEQGHTNIVKYILEQEESSNHLERFKDHSLQWACMKGHLDLVKFHVSIDEREIPVQFFMNAITASHFDLINFFIFELKIDECEEIKEFLEMYPRDNADKVKSLFRTRDLKDDLNLELSSKDKLENKKNKI